MMSMWHSTVTVMDRRSILSGEHHNPGPLNNFELLLGDQHLRATRLRIRGLEQVCLHESMIRKDARHELSY